jgi:hypothetical protein
MYLDGGLPGAVGVVLVVLGVFWRGLQLIGQGMNRRHVLDDERVMRTLSGVAIMIYVIANTMSDSFGTATMPVFVTFAAFAFVTPCQARTRPRSHRLVSPMIAEIQCAPAPEVTQSLQKTVAVICN